MRASGSVTLLKGPQKNILVDAGSPWDKDEIIQGEELTTTISGYCFIYGFCYLKYIC